MADRENKGRNAPTQGTSNGRAKLTDADVSKIFSHHASGQSYRKIGAIMGINYAHVGRILRRRAWRHLSLPPA